MFVSIDPTEGVFSLELCALVTMACVKEVM